MLDDLMQWIAAGDHLITAMGPITAIALSCVGGYGVTQLLKFPVRQFVAGDRGDYLIEILSVVTTWTFIQSLGHLAPMVNVLIAVAQPLIYSEAMAIIRRRWPWLEATRALGSAAPSPEAVAALQARK